jgi:hypothetical protein
MNSNDAQLSPVQRRIRILFPKKHWADVIVFLIEQCGDRLPFAGTIKAEGVERIQCAVLKCSGGDFERLADAVAMANSDWRDVLIEAGFAWDVSAHEQWLTE